MSRAVFTSRWCDPYLPVQNGLTTEGEIISCSRHPSARVVWLVRTRLQVNKRSKKSRARRSGIAREQRVFRECHLIYLFTRRSSPVTRHSRFSVSRSLLAFERSIPNSRSTVWEIDKTWHVPFWRNAKSSDCSHVRFIAKKSPSSRPFAICTDQKRTFRGRVTPEDLHDLGVCRRRASVARRERRLHPPGVDGDAEPVQRSESGSDAVGSERADPAAAERNARLRAWQPRVSDFSRPFPRRDRHGLTLVPRRIRPEQNVRRVHYPMI